MRLLKVSEGNRHRSIKSYVKPAYHRMAKWILLDKYANHKNVTKLKVEIYIGGAGGKP
jgi:hypothetical protein